MTDKPHTPTEVFDENQRTALIYTYGEQVERTYRSVSHDVDEAQLDKEAHGVRVKAVGERPTTRPMGNHDPRRLDRRRGLKTLTSTGGLARYDNLEPCLAAAAA